jgi:hypothetical protein
MHQNHYKHPKYHLTIYLSLCFDVVHTVCALVRQIDGRHRFVLLTPTLRRSHKLA